MGVQMDGYRLRVTLGSRKRFAKTILNLGGVQRVIDRVTRRLEGESRGRLARHRRTGDHQVFAYRDRHTRVIVLTTTSGNGSPMSIQFGHWERGRWVEALNILPTARKGKPDGA